MPGVPSIRVGAKSLTGATEGRTTFVLIKLAGGGAEFVRASVRAVGVNVRARQLRFNALALEINSE